jgi:hypothetical protein
MSHMAYVKYDHVFHEGLAVVVHHEGHRTDCWTARVG